MQLRPCGRVGTVWQGIDAIFIACKEVVVDLGSDFYWKPEKGALMITIMVSTVSTLRDW